MTTDARTVALATEDHREALPSADERLAGYGVMGLPFASGHYLALRRFPSTPFGAPYSLGLAPRSRRPLDLLHQRRARGELPPLLRRRDRLVRPHGRSTRLDRTRRISRSTAGPIRWSLDVASHPGHRRDDRHDAARCRSPRWENRAVLAAMSRGIPSGADGRPDPPARHRAERPVVPGGAGRGLRGREQHGRASTASTSARSARYRSSRTSATSGSRSAGCSWPARASSSASTRPGTARRDPARTLADR